MPPDPLGAIALGGRLSESPFVKSWIRPRIAKAKGEELEISAVRLVSNTSSPRLKRRYEIRVFVSRVLIALEQPNVIIFLFVVFVE